MFCFDGRTTVSRSRDAIRFMEHASIYKLNVVNLLATLKATQLELYLSVSFALNQIMCWTRDLHTRCTIVLLIPFIKVKNLEV